MHHIIHLSFVGWWPVGAGRWVLTTPSGLNGFRFCARLWSTQGQIRAKRSCLGRLVDCITLSTSLSLIGGLGEQGGDFSLPGIGGFAGATEGRSSLFSVIFLSDAALLSALALASAFFCLGFRPAFFFGPVFCILIFQFAKEQLISALRCVRKYLGPLPDGAPRTASILGSRYLRTHLSAEINPAEASCTRLH